MDKLKGFAALADFVLSVIEEIAELFRGK